MKLYEVGEDVRAGFKLTVQEGIAPHVQMALMDDLIGGPSCLSLGNSLCRELRHPDDQGKPFVLQWGELSYSNAGMMLISQKLEKAERDHRALVLVDRCYVGELMTDVESVDGRSQPEHLTYASGDGVRRDLFLMRPGNALYIRWHKKLLGSRFHKKFIISWDADVRELVKSEVTQKKRGWFSQRRSEREQFAAAEEYLP